jgi:cytochrome P450
VYNDGVQPGEQPSLAFDERFFRAPHDALGQLRDSGSRAAWLPRMETIMLLGYDDVLAALLDKSLGAMGTSYYEQMGWTEGPYIEWIERTVVFLDPPDHDRLRALLNRAFTPRQVARVRPITEKFAAALADRAAELREVDLYDAFAQKLPLQVICSVIGIPEVDFEQMGSWTEALSLATAYPGPAQRVAADDAMRGLCDYAGDLIEERRRAPSDDLLSTLIQVEEAGDRLTADELVAMVAQMLYAGHETTRNLIGNGLFTLLQNADQLVRLRENRALLDPAVEEMLRFEPPILYLSRVVREHGEWGGVRLEPGRLIMLGLASANRDPRHFPEPDRFDVGRLENRHLSFGYGAHFCLGASIARMEARVAFETLLDRFSSIEWAGDEPRWADDTALRTLEEFPVRLHAA